MKDMTGRVIQVGDILVAIDTASGEATGSRYKVKDLGALENSDLVVERQFSDGVARPWCTPWLSAFWAGCCYQIEGQP